MDNITTNEQERLTVSFYLLSVLLILQFIPLPAFNFLGGKAFDNFIYLAILLLIVFRSNSRSRLNSTNSKIVRLLLIYYVTINVFSFIRGDGFGDLFAELKCVLYIAFIVIYCSNRYRFLKILKLFVLFATISVIFGLLVYFIGEPFVTIRLWLTQTQTTSREIYIGKGSQLTGIYCTPAIFGYMMTVAPILCLALYYAEKKFIWVVSLMVCILGLFLNAERAPMGMNAVMIGIWVLREKGKVVGIILSAIAIVGFSLAAPMLQDVKSDLKSAYSTGDLSKRMKGTDSKEFSGRFEWQIHGIRTVMHHPLIGASYIDYTQQVLADQNIMINDRSRLSKISKTTLAPHNHYVNIGMHAGVFGWFLLVIMFKMMIKITRTKNMQHIVDNDMILIRKALTMSLFAVLCVALFHNPGIFDGELATCSVLAFIMTLNNMKSREKAI